MELQSQMSNMECFRVYPSINPTSTRLVEIFGEISLNSIFDCDPYSKGVSFFKVEDLSNYIESILESFEVTDAISTELLCLILGAMVLYITVLHQSKNTAKKKRYNEDMYYKVGAVKSKYFTSLIP